MNPTAAIAEVIQLALAPTFMLVAAGGFLNVLTQRLGRVIDRARRLEVELAAFDPSERARALAELKLLERRMTFAHVAIYGLTASALAVGVVIALLFTGELVRLDFSRAVAGAFIAAMALLIGGLACFLVEIRVARASVHVRRDLLDL